MNATLCEYPKVICVSALKSCSAKLLWDGIAFRFEVERGLMTSKPESPQTEKALGGLDGGMSQTPKWEPLPGPEWLGPEFKTLKN